MPTTTTSRPDSSPQVIPAPAGYAPSTSADTPDGPVTVAEFDKVVGAGAAATYHFKQGYDVTYDNSSTNESVEVTLLTFDSTADATRFVPLSILNATATSLSPTHSTLSAIPASAVLSATKAGSDGFYYTDVVALKGNTIMMLEYADDSPYSGVPDVLTTAAEAQYASL